MNRGIRNMGLGTWLLSKFGHWVWEHPNKTCPSGERHCPHMHWKPDAPWWLIRSAIVNNRWAARRRWKKLPEGFRDKLTVALMESHEGMLVEDPEWPGVRFTSTAHAQLEELRRQAGNDELLG